MWVFSPITTQKLTLDKNNLYVDDTLFWTATYTTFSTVGNLTIFALNRSGSIIEYSSCKLYSCKIYDNETLIRDYIPVKRSDGLICLYDKVNKKYYYNLGTGNFISGPEKV